MYYAFIISLICLALGVGWAAISGIPIGVDLFMTLGCLALMEISLSFDNAIVNASILEKMSFKWRKIFLFWGILIAVFVVRFTIPTLIVSIGSGQSPVDIVSLLFNNPKLFSEMLAQFEGGISIFGGAFLLSVGLWFFTKENIDTHWLPIERKLQGNELTFAVSLLAVITGVTLLSLVSGYTNFILCLVMGLVTFACMRLILSIFEDTSGVVLKTGLASFLYLELIDASFSMDGVMAAFAFTSDIVLIMLGLCIGAVFIRSLTLILLEREVLITYKYLQNGAYWTILALALLMIFGSFFHIPKIVFCLTSIGILISSVYCSKY